MSADCAIVAYLMMARKSGGRESYLPLLTRISQNSVGWWYDSRPPPYWIDAGRPSASMPNDGPVPKGLAARSLLNQYAGTPCPPSRVPECTASMSWKAPATAPDGRMSPLKRPAEISSTFFPQSTKTSWKISRRAHVLCILNVTFGCWVIWPTPPAVAVAAAPAPGALGGAFCDRHAARNAPTGPRVRT